MESVNCPWCNEKIYSASFVVGKVKCSFCGREFFIGYDEIRHLWLATDADSPIQAMIIRKARKNEAK